jgi:hypothetical protein
MGRRKPIPEHDSLEDIVRRLYALDIYKTGTSLACKAARVIELLKAENSALYAELASLKEPQGSD